MLEFDLRSEEGSNNIHKYMGEYAEKQIKKHSLLHNTVDSHSVHENELMPGITEEEQRKDVVFAWRDLSNGSGVIRDDVYKYIEGERYAIPLTTHITSRYSVSRDEIITNGIDHIVNKYIVCESIRKIDEEFICMLDFSTTKTEQVLTVEMPYENEIIKDELKIAIASNGLVYKDDQVITMIEKQFPHPSVEFIYLILDENAINSLHYGDYKVWAQWKNDGDLAFQGWARYGLGINNAEAITKIVIK